MNRRMSKLEFPLVLLAMIGLSASSRPLTEDFRSWPRWRGFNLLEKFHKSWSNGPFKEDDFRMISELGFNFVRLPMDYRVWCKDGNPEKFDEKVLKEIDQAVAWGRKYGLHVSLNFHRGPGFSVADPKEPASLWTDKRMRKLFVKHWKMFAKRYRGIPSRELSFNLLNEPFGDESVRLAYIEVATETVNAIRRIDPKRLIISDGFGYGRMPLQELLPLDIVQAGRGYEPFQLTHYKASWVQGSTSWPEPVWPPRKMMPNILYGPGKPEFKTPLEIRGSFPAGTLLRVSVRQVSSASRLLVKTDKEVVFDRSFLPGAGTGEWKQVIFETQWNIYQNIYDTEYEMKLSSRSDVLLLENTEGDWMSFNWIEVIPPSERKIRLNPDTYDWGVKQSGLLIGEDGLVRPLSPEPALDGREWLKKEVFGSWIASRTNGHAVFIGEWGAHQFTPHGETLEWMEDNLAVWKEAGLGWALWNFRGSFGILDSDRKDVEYEEWNGHKLDRKMLQILQAY